MGRSIRAGASCAATRHEKANRLNRRHSRFDLTLDPSVEGANMSYRRWIDNTSDLVEVAIASGAIKDTSHGHRLAWNLCAGFSGAANAVAVLREDLDLPARVDDLLTAHLSLVLER